MKLLEPVAVSGICLRNRLALAPVTRGMAAADGIATDETLRYYRKFAQGGVGLIITEATYVAERHAQTYLGQTGLANETHVDGWARVVDAVHDEGARIFVQLQHGGRFREPALGAGLSSCATLPKTRSWQQGRTYTDVRLASAIDLEGVIEGFSRSAALAAQAGFDGVELHGSRGYLLDELMCGTGQEEAALDERLRFPLAVIAATRRAAPTVSLGYNLSLYKMDDLSYQPAGGEQEIGTIVSALAKCGVDYLHISTRALDRCRIGEAPFIDVVRRGFGGMIIAGGGIQSLVEANMVIERGRADLVSMARTLVANPDIIARSREGREIVHYSRGMERIPVK